MTNSIGDQGQAAVAPGAKKLPYRTPRLTTFGKVHHLTQASTSGSNGDAGQGMMASFSDRRLKRNIVAIGRHPLGFGVYLYEYRDGFGPAGRQFGVMADEVEAIVPQAVGLRADGYKYVHYGMIGVDPA